MAGVSINTDVQSILKNDFLSTYWGPAVGIQEHGTRSLFSGLIFTLAIPTSHQNILSGSGSW